MLQKYETRDEKCSRIRMNRVGKILGIEFIPKISNKHTKTKTTEDPMPLGKNYRPLSTPKFAICQETGNIRSICPPKKITSKFKTVKAEDSIRNLEQFYQQNVLDRAMIEYQFVRTPRESINKTLQKGSKRIYGTQKDDSIFVKVLFRTPNQTRNRRNVDVNYILVSKLKNKPDNKPYPSVEVRIDAGDPVVPHSHIFCQQEKGDLLSAKNQQQLRNNFIKIGRHQITNINDRIIFGPPSKTETTSITSNDSKIEDQETLIVSKISINQKSGYDYFLPPILLSNPRKVVEKLCPHFFPEDVEYFKDMNLYSFKNKSKYLHTDEAILGLDNPDEGRQSVLEKSSSNRTRNFFSDGDLSKDIFHVQNELQNKFQDIKPYDDDFVKVPGTEFSLRDILKSSICQQKLQAAKKYPQVDNLCPKSSQNEMTTEFDVLSEKINSHNGLEHVYFVERAKLYRLRNELEKANEDISQAIEERPSYLKAYWEQHLIYILQGNYADAMRELDHMQSRNPETPFVFLSRAELLKIQGNTKEAIENYANCWKMGYKKFYVLYSKAELLEEINVREAIEAYQECHKIDPEDIPTLLKISNLYYKTEEYVRCIEFVKKIHKLGVKNSEAYSLEIKSLVKLSRWKEALNVCGVAIRFDKNNSQFYFLCGCILRNIKPTIAYLLLKKALGLDPSNVEILVAMGYIEINMKRYEDAMATFERIHKVSKNDIRAIKAFAVICMRNNKFQLALSKFESVIDIDFENTEAHFGRAYCYSSLNNNEQALKEYDKIIYLFPSNKEARILRGKLLLKMKELEISSMCIRTFAAMFASDPFVKNNSELKAFLGDVNKTEHDCFDNMEAYILAANGLMLNRNWESSIKCLKIAHERYKDSADENPKGFAEILKLLGHCHLIVGSKSIARELLSKSIRLNRKSYMAHYLYGVSLIARKNFQETEFHLVRALSLKPDLHEAHISLAICFLNQKRYSKAICCCNEAIRMKKSFSSYFLLRGVVKCAMNHFELGLEDLDASLSLNSFNFYSIYFKGLCCERLSSRKQAVTLYSYIIEKKFKDLLDKCLQQRGMIYYQFEAYDKAACDFKRIKSQWASFMFIKCKLRMGENGYAILATSSLIRENPTLVEAYILRAVGFFKSEGIKNVERAIEDMRTVLKSDSDNYMAKINLGIFLHYLGDLKTSFRGLREIVDQSHHCGEARVELSLIYLTMGHPEEAYSEITEAIRISPLPIYYSNRGFINMLLGKTAAAKSDFLEALKLKGDYFPANFNISSLYFQQGINSEALKHVENCVSASPENYMAHTKMATIMTRCSRHQLALASAERALMLQKDAYFVLFIKSYNLYKLGRFKEAEVSCRKYLIRFTQDLDAINLLKSIKMAQEMV